VVVAVLTAAPAPGGPSKRKGHQRLGSVEDVNLNDPTWAGALKSKTAQLGKLGDALGRGSVGTAPGSRASKEAWAVGVEGPVRAIFVWNQVRMEGVEDGHRKGGEGRWPVFSHY
jgi:hypothetical protein